MAIKSIREINGLVNVFDMDPSLIIDLKYATEDNFTKRLLYPVNICVLRKETALKLINANVEFKKLGYRIKIWDAYRPMQIQKILWDIFPDERFVANPNKIGSRHSYGTAVDVTLVDKFDREISMPSEFDEFSERTCRKYKDIGAKESANSNILTEVMMRNGFEIIDTEWWHFEDSDYLQYEIIDVELQKFIL